MIVSGIVYVVAVEVFEFFGFENTIAIVVSDSFTRIPMPIAVRVGDGGIEPFAALSKLGKFAPAKPRAPMFRKERRDKPSQNLRPDLP